MSTASQQCQTEHVQAALALHAWNMKAETAAYHQCVCPDLLCCQVSCGCTGSIPLLHVHRRYLALVCSAVLERMPAGEQAAQHKWQLAMSLAARTAVQHALADLNR